VTYYPDLSAYTYLRDLPEDNVVNVGWLDPEHPYERGPVPEGVLPKIFELCSKPVNRTRGYHVCPFCDVKQMGLRVVMQGRQLTLGGAEIRVSLAGQKTYAAPDLIFHYMGAHAYRPPEEFVQAVLSLP
jgi:hypothetical protein